MPSSGYNHDDARDKIFFSIKDSKSVDHKTKLVGTLPGAADLVNIDVETKSEDIKVVVPLKHLTKFMFNLDFLLINTEIELILKWSQDCVLTGRATRKAMVEGAHLAAEPTVPANDGPKDLKFNITDCKMYVPVVTLQQEYQNQLYRHLKTGISIDFMWNKYRPQVINQTSTNNLNYLIDPTFNNVKRFFFFFAFSK